MIQSDLFIPLILRSLNLFERVTQPSQKRLQRNCQENAQNPGPMENSFHYVQVDMSRAMSILDGQSMHLNAVDVYFSMG